MTSAQIDGLRPGTDPKVLAVSLWAALHGLAGLWRWGGLAEADLGATLDVTLDAYLG